MFHAEKREGLVREITCTARRHKHVNDERGRSNHTANAKTQRSSTIADWQLAPLLELALRFRVFFETILPGKRESLSWQKNYRNAAKADFVDDRCIAILATILSRWATER